MAAEHLSFWPSFSFGAIVGAIVAEGVKHLIGTFSKRMGDKSEAKRKLLREDAQALQGRLDPLVRSSLEYFSKPSGDGKEVASRIKLELKLLATSWHLLNKRLHEIGEKMMPPEALIRFRQALTSEIDVVRGAPVQLEAPIVEEIHLAATRMQDEISKVKYKNT